MATDQEVPRRLTVLRRLADLCCQAPEADAVAHFVEERAQLLRELETLGGRWTQHEQMLLKQALHYGERVLAEVSAYRSELARQLGQVQEAKRRSHPENWDSRSRLTRVL